MSLVRICLSLDSDRSNQMWWAHLDSVGVEGEDVAGDEEQPVDVLVEIGEHRVDQLVVLTDEPLHLPVQPREPPLDELRQEGEGVRGGLAAQRPDRRQGVLINTIKPGSIIKISYFSDTNIFHQVLQW